MKGDKNIHLTSQQRGKGHMGLSLLWLLCTAATVQISYAGGDTELSVTTWNLLAPIWVDRQYYEESGKVDMNLLDNDIRLQLVIERIMESQVDIVNLQEVQEDTFPTIRDGLAKYYKPVAFAPNTDNYWEEYLPKGIGYVNNGVATFYKKKRLKLRSEDIHIIPTAGDLGSVALVTVLWPRRRAFLGEDYSGLGDPIININCHLEAGVGVTEPLTRISQATAISEAVDAIETELKNAFTEKDPIIIWSGDFNSVDGFPAIIAIKAMGFSNVMETLGVSESTYYYLEPILGVSGVTIDHVFVSAEDESAGHIQFVSAEVPDIWAEEFSEEDHTATLVDLLSDEMRKKRLRGRNEIITYLLSSELFSNIYLSRSDDENYDEYEAVRALRLGSDHLPVKVVMNLKF